MGSKIRAFLFDIGNVLVRFDFSIAMRALAALSKRGEEAEALARFEAAKLLYEDGQLSRAEFLQQGGGHLEFGGQEADFVGAWQGIFTLNEPMVSVVERLRADGFPLYLLSNTNCIHVEGLFRDFPVFANFHGGTYSHLARASKPGRRIYEIACEQHGLTPAETFFIDDLEANIATAKDLGFHAHQYHPNCHGDLLAELERVGVKVG